MPSGYFFSGLIGGVLIAGIALWGFFGPSGFSEQRSAADVCIEAGGIPAQGDLVGSSDDVVCLDPDSLLEVK